MIILNNMAGTALPQGYPIHLRFDNSTPPTAADLYASSHSNPKSNDLRIVYGDAIELNRVDQQRALYDFIAVTSRHGLISSEWASITLELSLHR